MYVKRTLMATDKNNEDVLIAKGDQITEIGDAGPMYGTMQAWNADGSYSIVSDMHHCVGWNVTCRFTPQHKLWTEIVTVDAIKLLKALEGE